jgi:hypothetical protein
MPHLPPAHHETSKHDSPNETKIKKQNKIIPDLNSNLAKSMTHHNQTKELSTWFLTIVMGSTHGGPPSPLWAMTEDSTEEFHMASDGEGRIDLPSPRRHGTGASPAPATTRLWPEKTLTARAMVTTLPWPDTDLPPRATAHWSGGEMSTSPRSAT